MAIIGIDVSKLKLDCLWLRDLSRHKVKSKIHPNTSQGHQALLAWALQQTGEAVESLHFVMEATGIYHETLAYALYEAGAQVSVVNPAQLREHAKSLGTRTKTDSKDSWVITHYGATQQPRRWQPEPDEVRLPARTRYLEGNDTARTCAWTYTQSAPMSSCLAAARKRWVVAHCSGWAWRV